jgi:hypothetical protein
MTAAVLVAGDAMGNLTTIRDGDPAPLIRAPQGGHILLVGARLQINSTCTLEATGSLRDIASNRVIGVDERTLYLTATGDGFAAPEASLSAMPNVAVCPTAATTAAIDGNPYQLEVAMTANDVPVADLKAMVVPTCDPSDGFCASECGSGN